MEHVILQPIGNKEARVHYRDTILDAVDLDEFSGYVNAELYKRIENIYPNKQVHIWGVTNGKNNANRKKWLKIKPGDVTLFARDKKIIKSAVTTLTFNNKKLAEKLWGINQEGETWENIYLVDELSNQDITYKDFCKIVGYKDNYVIQGFSYLDADKSLKVLTALDILSNTFIGDVSKEEYIREIEKLYNGQDLDNIVNGTSRKEQGYLRKILFGQKTSFQCGICGREYPIDLLIAAHIKRRADCTREERLDAENIVMPMCKFGCDDLYEKGYLLIEQGVIKKNPKKYLTVEGNKYIKYIENKYCEYWNEKTSKYFESHNHKCKEERD